MSVMLRTTNPDAVREIDPDRDLRQPYAGQFVLFHARPGEGYGGYNILPALVIRVLDEDRVDLRVEGPDESIFRINIPRKSDQNIFHVWTFNDYDQKHYLRNEQPAPENYHVDDVPQQEPVQMKRRVRRADD